MPINGTVNIDPPAECDRYYSVTSGYRKVAGDICEGGVEHPPLRLPCPNNKSWIFDYLLIGAIVAGVYWIY